MKHLKKKVDFPPWKARKRKEQGLCIESRSTIGVKGAHTWKGPLRPSKKTKSMGIEA